MNRPALAVALLSLAVLAWQFAAAPIAYAAGTSAAPTSHTTTPTAAAASSSSPVSSNSPASSTAPASSPSPVREASPVHVASPWDEFLRVLFARDYNTRMVLWGTSLLGVSAGIVGTFMLLRKRSLAGDVVGHASLPGIAAAFLIMEAFAPGSGKSLVGLLVGAFIAGALGILSAMAIDRYTRMKEDAALAVVLSIFFGLGVALFTIVQNIPSGNAAGLSGFIFGKAASIVASDVELIAWSALGVAALCAVLFKEFSLLCFDEEFAASQGWPVGWLDLMLMGLVVGVTVIGLQSVGLLLVVAMLVIPAAAARAWTDDLARMACISAAIGGLSAYVGVFASALIPKLAAGATIVLVEALFFVASMFLGAERGIVWRVWSHWDLQRALGRQSLLRACYEYLEATDGGVTPGDLKGLAREVHIEAILPLRSWSHEQLDYWLARARREGLIEFIDPRRIRLTPLGGEQASRAIRNQRLWEVYLRAQPDAARARVDRDVNQIEQIIEPELLADLERRMLVRYPQMMAAEGYERAAETGR